MAGPKQLGRWPGLLLVFPQPAPTDDLSKDSSAVLTPLVSGKCGDRRRARPGLPASGWGARLDGAPGWGLKEGSHHLSPRGSFCDSVQSHQLRGSGTTPSGLRRGEKVTWSSGECSHNVDLPHVPLPRACTLCVRLFPAQQSQGQNWEPPHPAHNPPARPGVQTSVWVSLYLFFLPPRLLSLYR